MAVLHSAVLLFALSGLFGKWLTISPSVIVFGRACFAAIALAIFINFFSPQSLKISRKLLLVMASTGVLLALHWLTFFHSVQVASVAIALITFATFPVFVSIFEPLFFKESRRKNTLLQAVLTLVGVGFVLPLQDLDVAAYEGILSGVFSALLFAILAILNRKYVQQVSAKHVAFYQNLFASLVLLPFILMLDVGITVVQLSLLMLLGIVFTAFAHTLYNLALMRLSAATVSVAVSLEPIYGIVAAYILLEEPITLLMGFGASVVILTNVWATKVSEVS
jgi:drug/metabolite transporter (DMT)-like permease